MKNRHWVVISAPVERVFAFVADYENDPQLLDEVRRMRQVSNRSVGVGTQAIGTSRVLGRELATTPVVTDYEENRRVVTKSVSGSVPIVGVAWLRGGPGSSRRCCRPSFGQGVHRSHEAERTPILARARRPWNTASTRYVPETGPKR
jgi:uncharacterized membrane protein